MTMTVATFPASISAIMRLKFGLSSVTPDTPSSIKNGIGKGCPPHIWRGLLSGSQCCYCRPLTYLPAKDGHIMLLSVWAYMYLLLCVHSSSNERPTNLGQLYLYEGHWNGGQIISDKWIFESTQVQSVWKARHLKYGYLWWVIDEAEHSYAALGDGGNAIYVNPKDRIVVAVSSLFVPRVKDRINFIKREIEPLFK